jgi:hypothetical protein
MADLVYEVSFRGVASDALRAAFDDCELEVGGGTTTLRCLAPALGAVLDRLQDLGLELIDVSSIKRPPATG